MTDSLVVTTPPLVGLDGMDDIQLDENIQVLIPSMRDGDRTALALLLVERHERCRTDEANAWLKDCETLYFLATHTFIASWICGKCGYEYWLHEGQPELDIPPFTPLEDLPSDFVCPQCAETALADFQTGVREPIWRKYAQAPNWTWSAFAMDTLDMSPGSASARKRTWEIFHIGLGWPVDMLLRAGPGRLGLAVGEMARTLPQGGDPVLAAKLLGTGTPKTAAADALALVEVKQEPDSWGLVWDYLKAKRRARDAAEGCLPSVKFQVEELHGTDGEDRGVTVEAWLNELIYEVGTFVWNEGLSVKVRDIFKLNLLEKLGK